MATKKQLNDLEEQNSILSRQLQARDDEIIRLSKHNNELNVQIEHYRSLNNHLAEERDRIFRSEVIAKQLNIDLMHALAVLGHRESERINAEVWQFDKPTNNYAVESIAMTTDDSQK